MTGSNKRYYSIDTSHKLKVIYLSNVNKHSITFPLTGPKRQEKARIVFVTNSDTTPLSWGYLFLFLFVVRFFNIHTPSDLYVRPVALYTGSTHHVQSILVIIVFTVQWFLSIRARFPWLHSAWNILVYFRAQTCTTFRVLQAYDIDGCAKLRICDMCGIYAVVTTRKVRYLIFVHLKNMRW